MTDIYINRILSLENGTISETELLDSPGVWVVLAEPGGGKTELLKNLANKLGVVPVRASIFRYQTSTDQVQSLVIDALDEVAKLDQSAIDAIIVKA